MRIPAVLLFLAMTSVGMAAQQLIDVVDPADANSVVNSATAVIDAEEGNFSLEQFNAHPYRLVVTMDPAGGYGGANGDYLNTVTFTAAQWQTDLMITFDAPRDANGDTIPEGENGFGRVIAGDGAQWVTSAPQSIAYGNLGVYTAKIIFDRDVYGVGFTVNRLQTPMTIRLLDVNDVQIGSDYTVLANSPTGSSHSFFGYYHHFAAEVRSVQLDLNGLNNQYSIDDVAVLYSTQGLPLCYEVAVPSDLNKDCHVDMGDLSILAGNWLTDNTQ